MYKFLWKKLARDPKQCGGSKKSIVILVMVLMLMMMMMMMVMVMMMMTMMMLMRLMMMMVVMMIRMMRMMRMMRKMIWMLRRKRMQFEEGNVEEEDRSQDRKEHFVRAYAVEMHMDHVTRRSL